MERSAQAIVDEILDGATTKQTVPQIIAKGEKPLKERLAVVYENLKVVARVILVNQITQTETQWELEPAKDLARGLVELAYLIDEDTTNQYIDEFKAEVATLRGR